MKTLIVDDDFTSRSLLQRILKEYGPANIAVNGKEALEAVRFALSSGEPYDLVCLDIMMPEMNGLDALPQMRTLEEEHGIVPGEGAMIIMTSALDNPKTVIACYSNLCDAYLVKPIEKSKLFDELRRLKLISKKG